MRPVARASRQGLPPCRLRSARTSLADSAELLQQREVVLEMPVLGDAPAGDAVDVGGDEIDGPAVALARGGTVAERPREVAREAQAANHAVAHQEHLLDLEVQIRHRSAE